MTETDNTNKPPLLGRYCLSLLLALAIVVLLYLLYGFYWEDAEKINASGISGSMCSPPYDAWFEENILFQVPILAYLSDIFRSVPVYGIWQVTWMIAYISVWIHLCLRMLSRRVNNTVLQAIALGCLFVFSVIGMSLVYISVSRGSILLSSGSLLLYLDYYLANERPPRWVSVLFAFGCFIRVTTAILVLAVISLLYWLVLSSFKRAGYLLRYFWAFVIVCLIIVEANKILANNPGQSIQQTYEYALEDRGDIISLSDMKSSVDSMRYQALTGYFMISDSAQINLAFVKRVIDDKRYLNACINYEDWEHLVNALPPLLNSNRLLFGSLYLMLLVMTLFSDKKTVAAVVVIHVISWAVVLILSMKINMYNRFLLPWLSMLFGASLYLVFMGNTNFRKWQSATGFFLLILTTFLVSGNLHVIESQETAYNKKVDSYLLKLDKLEEISVPIIWDYDQLYFPTRVLQRPKPDALRKSIYQTMFFCMYQKFGQKRCLDKFGFSPIDWKNMNIVLHKSTSGVSYVMEKRVASFLQSYYYTLYGLNFRLILDTPPNEIIPDNFVYHLQPDTVLTIQ